MGKRSWWLVLDRPDPELSLSDPGFGGDLTVRTQAVTMAGMWSGYLEPAIRSGSIVLEGPSHLRRAFPGWLNLFARVERPAADV